MPRAKPAIVAVMVVSLLLSLGGCLVGDTSDEQTEVEIDAVELKAIGLQYLKDRYGMTFEVTSYLNGAWGQNLYGFNATTAKFRHKQPFSVRWHRENGVDFFNEDYLYQPMEEEYDSLIEWYLEEIYTSFHVNTRLRGPLYPSSFNGMTGLEEFHSWGRDLVQVHTTVTVPSESPESVAGPAFAIEAKLKELHPIGSINIVARDPASFQLYVETSNSPPPFGEWPDIPGQNVYRSEWGM